MAVVHPLQLEWGWLVCHQLCSQPRKEDMLWQISEAWHPSIQRTWQELECLLCQYCSQERGAGLKASTEHWKDDTNVGLETHWKLLYKKPRRCFLILIWYFQYFTACGRLFNNPLRTLEADLLECFVKCKKLHVKLVFLMQGRGRVCWVLFFFFESIKQGWPFCIK